MKRVLNILFLFAAFAFAIPFINSGDPVITAVSSIAVVTVTANLILPPVAGILGMNNMDARMVFENSKDALVKAFGTTKILEIVKLTQGSLRFEQPLVVGQTLYTFPTLDNQNIFSPLEDRLLLQDSFVISSIKIGTGAPTSLADNTFLPDTYANPVKYGANAVPLQAWWNAGNFQMAVNNDIILPKWDLLRHYNAAETQQTAALGAGSPMDQDRGAFDGWYPMEPNIVMIGQKNTVFQVILKGLGLSAVLANSRAIIQVRGVLAQNSTLVS